MKRVALIVGGASGIGAASATILAGDHVVAVADVSLSAAEAQVSHLPGNGHLAASVDVGDPASIEKLFDTIETTLGPIAVLVITAGVTGYVDGKRPSVRTSDIASWDRVMDINVRGTFLCIQQMLRRREHTPVEAGRIITTASVAAQNGGVNSPPSYVASKGAVLSLTKVAAHEAAALGVTVNAIAPGSIDTPMLRSVIPAERHDEFFNSTGIGRPGSAEEMAAVIAFLASPASSFVNGTCFDVNGGLLMR